MSANIYAREQKTENYLLHIAVNKRNYELAEWFYRESSVIGGAINYMLQTLYHLAYYTHGGKKMNLLTIRTNGAACDDPMNGETSDDELKESINGDTPLHITVRTKNYELAEWLCQRPQVNIEALNYAQQTPYHRAYKCNDAKMMTILQENKINKIHMIPDIIISSNGGRGSDM
ncbi:uncharacterized protein LOC123274764 [Cotesia glomerata]|uniref:Uncharacterized protein n=1 Tax=Cotesia glomerata TaxID=32391 RepID=A0AAV7IIH7_COTGL|nr:uncharacterized protein LOC123274764 [Cotesia glomerata]KAH0553179.1 hypothetical protein KQX54_000351 [Cotesia glomerata]